MSLPWTQGMDYGKDRLDLTVPTSRLVRPMALHGLDG